MPAVSMPEGEAEELKAALNITEAVNAAAAKRADIVKVFMRAYYAAYEMRKSSVWSAAACAGLPLNQRHELTQISGIR